MTEPTTRKQSEAAAHGRHESDDAFLGGRLRLFQPGTGYRAGIDGVLLAATIKPGTGSRILDLGSGVGVVGLCVARRLADAHVTMVERDASLAALARRNIECNGLAGRVRVIEADILRRLGDSPELAAARESFDHVLANPPFHADGRGTAAGDPVKAGANAMPAGALEGWARMMAAMARPGGQIMLIHRAEALAEVLTALGGRFGAATIIPLHPRAGQPASRILVRAIKGSRAPLELRPGILLHDAGNSFRPGIAAVLRDGAELAV